MVTGLWICPSGAFRSPLFIYCFWRVLPPPLSAFVETPLAGPLARICRGGRTHWVLINMTSRGRVRSLSGSTPKVCVQQFRLFTIYLTLNLILLVIFARRLQTNICHDLLWENANLNTPLKWVEFWCIQGLDISTLEEKKGLESGVERNSIRICEIR